MTPTTKAMTSDQLKQARESLGLSQSQLARLVGYEGVNVGQRISAMETGHRGVIDQVWRLVNAYLDGHRPADWPLDPATD